MWEFFRGWRRKVGVLTLVMALVLMGGWIRSLVVYDVFVFKSDNRQQLLLAMDGSVYWLSMEMNLDTGLPMKEWLCVGASVDASVELQHIRLANGCDESTVPYWSIVIPLTIFSTFLLLSKPRKSTSKMCPEPVPAGEA